MSFTVAKRILKDVPFLYKYGSQLRQNYWSRLTDKAYKKYISSTGKPKLQLGSGQNYLEDWFNTDYFPRENIFFLNSIKHLNFEDDSFNFIFSEHHIEHIQYNDAKLMLTEAYRILKKNGVIRICTPNLESYLNTFFDKNGLNNLFVEDIMSNWIKTGFYNAKHYIPSVDNKNISFFINDIFMNYEHKFIYDFETLKSLLFDAGFKNIYRTNAGTSEYPELNKIEFHDQLYTLPFTLAVEAVK